MRIAGLQKLTLLDYPGKVACTIFLQGCNLRCPFCHNAQIVDVAPEGPGEDDMLPEELLAFLRKRAGILEGVCVTGGEPLLGGIDELRTMLEQAKGLGYAIKLDTNGCFPTKLRALVEAGLVDYVALDVKNSPERYPATVGLPRFDVTPVRQTVSYLLGGPVDYEMRTTVTAQLHDEAAFEEIAAWVSGCKRFYLQPFVDRDTVPEHDLGTPSPAELERYARILREAGVAHVEIRGQ